MLTKDGIMDRYAKVRKYTARFSGENIMEVEEHVKEISKSHVDALEELVRLRGIISKYRRYVNPTII